MLYRLTSRNGKIVAGAATRDGVVTEAADVFAWAIGKRVALLLNWCKSKRFTVEIISEQQRSLPL